MVGLGIHLFVYVAGISLLIVAWVLSGGGTVDDLRQIAQNPAQTSDLGFWPAWVIAGWTSLLVVHIGVVLSIGTFGRRARKRPRCGRRKSPIRPADRSPRFPPHLQ